ncbi:hypothetical protein [Sulfuricystis multivorans]|uniref:hypothetical protein n=1 Tax=Sulfuricystis multivorans TaxID=2211108 RepID=UPI000F846513|nr:hypothetical protein [Sulfuricystis multivorans]
MVAPVQAAAAVTIPLCRHTPEQAVTAAAHGHEQVAKQVAPARVGDLDCDDCLLCHLTCTGFLLAAQ